MTPYYMTPIQFINPNMIVRRAYCTFPGLLWLGQAGLLCLCPCLRERGVRGFGGHRGAAAIGGRQGRGHPR